MNQRDRKVRPFLLRLASCLLLATPAAAGAAAGEPPNIVFLLVDDLRWDMLGHAGAPVETPAIDRLAAEGVRFAQAFTVTSLCSPSRATMLTGVYPHVHGVTGNQTELDPAGPPTVAQLLRQHGYETAMIGKWHMGPSSRPRPGWDRWFGMAGQGEYSHPRFNDNGWLVRRPGYNTDIVTDEAIRFIRAHAAPSSAPFFLHVGYKAVHAPFTPARRHVGLHDGRAWPIRPSVVNPWLQLRRSYADTLAAVDESVARIDAALDAAGIRENTVVVFTSDNGYMFGEHWKLDKRLFFEESIRIPLIVRWPARIPPGTTRQEQVLNLDFAPTWLELAGASVPEHMQGRSMARLLEGRREPWRDAWLYAYYRELEWPQMSTMLAVRTDRFKYVEFPEGPDLFCYVTGRPLLFDLERDPYELHDFADVAAYRRDVESLSLRLAELREEVGYRNDPLALSSVRSRLERLAEQFSSIAAEVAEHYPDGFADWDSRVCPAGTIW